MHSQISQSQLEYLVSTITAIIQTYFIQFYVFNKLSFTWIHSVVIFDLLLKRIFQILFKHNFSLLGIHFFFVDLVMKYFSLIFFFAGKLKRITLSLHLKRIMTRTSMIH